MPNRKNVKKKLKTKQMKHQKTGKAEAAKLWLDIQPIQKYGLNAVEHFLKT